MINGRDRRRVRQIHQLVSAIWRTWARESRPTLRRLGSAALLDPQGLLDQHGRGRRLRDEREGAVSKTVISTGVMRPFWSAVCALNACRTP